MWKDYVLKVKYKDVKIKRIRWILICKNNISFKFLYKMFDIDVFYFYKVNKLKNKNNGIFLSYVLC